MRNDELLKPIDINPALPKQLPRSLSRNLPRTKGLGIGLRVLLAMLEGMKIGRLEVNLPNGSKRIYEGTEPGPHGILNIRDKRLVRRVLLGGEVGFDEAYLDGLWDSPDLAPLLAVMYLNEPHYLGPYEKNIFSRLYGYWQHRRRHNSKENARKNIEAHYDLGNEFYRLWLDDTMAYSSAVFTHASNETLHDAQINKFRNMYQRLGLKSEHHLLEVGSGWGGFAIYAAQQSGCRVTSITLSNEQLVESQKRADAAGVGDRVHFELRDYRDVTETYDRAVSIEMYEAVGEKYWPGYFRMLNDVLKPGGCAVIQGITIDESIFEAYKVKQDFIQKYIFPGGMLATKNVFFDQARAAGLQVSDPSYFGHDYADTLALWHRNVLTCRESILRMFDPRFLRLWRYYLAYCEAGFRVDKIDLMQVTLLKA